MVGSGYDSMYIDEPICQCIKCARFCHMNGSHNCGGYVSLDNKINPIWCFNGGNHSAVWFCETEKQTKLRKELDDYRKPAIIPDKEFHEQYELLKNDINKKHQ